LPIAATFLNPVSLKSWFVLVPIEMLDEVSSFIRNLQKLAKDMGMKIDEPRIIGLSDDSVSCFTSQLDKLLLKDKPQLVCCFLRTRGEERYNAIKRKCCLDRAGKSLFI
jgi:aubergine-like protein